MVGRTFAAGREDNSLEAEVRRSILEVEAIRMHPGEEVLNSRREEEGHMLLAAAAGDSQGEERPIRCQNACSFVHGDFGDSLRIFAT